MHPRLKRQAIHAAAAAAAKGPAPSSAVLPSGAKDLAAYTTYPSRLTACVIGMSPTKEGRFVYSAAERESMRQVLIATYGDYALCDRHKDRVMWSVKLQLAESNHEELDVCGQCPAQLGELLCHFEYPAGTFPKGAPIFPAHIEALEGKWKQARNATTVLFDPAKAWNHAAAPSEADKSRSRIAEVAAWEAYTMAVVDVVTPNLLREYRGLAAASPEQRAQILSEAKNLPKYEKIAREWKHNSMTRGSGNFAFCFMHRTMGHMVPVDGERAYNLQCGVCYDEVYRAAAKAGKVFDAAAPSAGDVQQMS